MFKRINLILVFSLIFVMNMLTPVSAAPGIVELIKPITDIKTVNKNMIISGWATIDTSIEVRVYTRASEKVEGEEVYRWEEYVQPGKEAGLVVGPTGFFAREVELKNGTNKVVIKAINPEDEEETIEGLVTLSSKEEVKEAVQNLMNFKFLDIIRKMIE